MGHRNHETFEVVLMADCKLTLHSRAVGGSVDPLRLLGVLAAQRGDIAVLHSGNDGNAVLAVNAISGVRLTADEGKITLHRTGLAARAQVPEDIAMMPSAAWQCWQNIITEISFSQPPPDRVGWLGWLSYEAGVMAELPQLYGQSSADIALAHWQIFESYFVLDAATRQWFLVALHPDFAEAEKIMEQMQRQFSAANTCDVPKYAPVPATGVQHPDGAAFKAAVRRCKEYIAGGDIYQANISAVWTARVAEPGSQVFCRLVKNNPAQYATFFRYGDDEIISASPELFLQRAGQLLETRPIKGTRPRVCGNPVADQQRCDELLHSEKDRSELAMIVDLLRNDLGRVCTSVSVEKARQIEKLPTLWHTHGVVTGKLHPHVGKRWDKIITAMCPGGSITGVPKIRAMEIIRELENQPRGIYCGNIGWISPAGDGMLNIAIRTIHIVNGIAKFRSGAGITADSNADEEYAEILAKASAPLRALTEEIL